jgi:DNA-binding NtrC family response regulator
MVKEVDDKGRTPHKRKRLTALKHRLAQLSQAWTVDDYWSLIQFQVSILPRVMSSERCTIYIMEMGTDRICSIFGTGLEKRRIEAPRKGSVVGKVISRGIPLTAENMDRWRGYHTEMDEETGYVTRNTVCAPIRSRTGHGVTGAVQVLNRTDGRPFTESDKTLLAEIADHLSISIESILLNTEILRISAQINREVDRFGEAFPWEGPFIAESPAMASVLSRARMLAATPVNVYIQGENGTGKELVARIIHEESHRREGPFVPVNCASIPETLAESEFFGYERGAFTGAQAARKGYFEEARGGILFLDEIADMPPSIQPKVLRALQEGEGRRLGGNRLLTYDARIISASNRPLEAEVEAGRFREDLFFRLFSVEIAIPPLRDRPEDILPMAHAFLAHICDRFGKRVAGFSPSVIRRMETFSWPGNVRQLRREVERLVALTPEGEMIPPDHLSPELAGAEEAGGGTADETEGVGTLPDRVAALEIKMIRSAMAEMGGNRTRAADRLGVTRQGLYKKMKRYGLTEGGNDLDKKARNL